MLSFIHTEHERIIRQVAERLGLEIGTVRPKRPPIEAGLAVSIEELRTALAETDRKLSLLRDVAEAADVHVRRGGMTHAQRLSDALAAARAGGAL